MTQINRRPTHGAMPTATRPRGAARRRPAREARIRRSFDGVVASYLRELSVNGDTARRASAEGGVR